MDGRSGVLMRRAAWRSEGPESRAELPVELGGGEKSTGQGPYIVAAPDRGERGRRSTTDQAGSAAAA